MDEYGFRSLAALPILVLGLYVYRSNPKEMSNRVFAVFCLMWTTFIVALNFVSLSNTIDTAQLFNRISVYSGLVMIPLLVHFVLIFPYRSNLLRHRWLLPLLYFGAALALAMTLVRERILIRFPSTDSVTGDYAPEARPALYFFLALSFTVAVFLLVMRYTLTDLDVTRKRLFFVTFALATYALYDAIDAVHINQDLNFKAGFVGEDDTYWRLTMGAAALLIMTFFSILTLLAFHTADPTRKREAWWLVGSGFAALLTGYFDPILRSLWLEYPGVLWLWRIAAISLVFYAILRYQLFDLHVRIRGGIRVAGAAFVFVATLFVVQRSAAPFTGPEWAYFLGLLAAAALVFFFEPTRRVIDRLAHKLVPATLTESGARHRALEIYGAALEGALADRILNPTEAATLRNLRATLGLSLDDHNTLERDIRARLLQVGQ